MHGIFNAIESILWFVIAIAVWWKSSPVGQAGRQIGAVAAAAFVAFGVSDLVEIQTGAFWRPIWLLAWKGVCILIFAACYARYRQIARSH